MIQFASALSHTKFNSEFQYSLKKITSVKNKGLKIKIGLTEAVFVK